MKQICRICLKAIPDLNFVTIKIGEPSQIKMQLSICVPEMVVDLVKDPIFCKFCVSALRSAYKFKNLCLNTEQRIQNYSRKVLPSKSIDIEDLLHDIQRHTRNSVCDINGGGKNTIKEGFAVPPNMNLLLTYDENLEDKQNLNTESNMSQRSVTLPVDASNSFNVVNVVANDFIKPGIQVSADELNNSLNDPIPIHSQVLKQENENEDVTTEEEDSALRKVESSSYECFEDNLFEDAIRDHMADVKSINNEIAILQTNIQTQSCFVKLTRLPDDIMPTSTSSTKYYLTKHELIQERKFYSCTSCNFHTVHKNLLIQHMPTHSSEKPFACNMCNIRFAQKWQLQKHLQIHTGKKTFACHLCPYRYLRKSSLQDHLRTHTGEKPFACNVCTYRTSFKSNLLKHQLIHTGEKPYACNVCNFRCTQKGNLQDHIRTHTGEKPFACNVCNFRCSQKSQLRPHLRTHSGEKPFACNVCNFRCIQKAHLQYHLQTHSGEKPFACNVCNFRCLRKSRLQYHLRTHSGEKPFACYVCTYRTGLKSQLQRHLEIHSRVKPFSCDTCNSAFSHKATLRRHMKKHQNPTLVAITVDRS